MLTCIPQHQDHQIQVLLEAEEGAEGGLVLFYNSSYYLGVGFSNGAVFSVKNQGKRKVVDLTSAGDKVFLRIRHAGNVCSIFYSLDSCRWTKLPASNDTSGFHHNVLGGFLSLRAGIYATGAGNVQFRNFEYKEI